MRRMYIFGRHGTQAGKLFVRYIVIGCVVLLGSNVFSQLLHISPSAYSFTDWESGGRRTLGRDSVVRRLSQEPGKHLVIVRYGANHDPNNEWVYNNADIDGSRIVWARDMSEEQNDELVSYFSSRKIWILEPDNRREPSRLDRSNATRP